jgi:hypothetical protein
VVNAVGLENPGIAEWYEKYFKRKIEPAKQKIILSISGSEVLENILFGP